MFLNYKFDQALVRTDKLLAALDIPVGALDMWKTQWRKKGNDCYDMGLRLIGNKESKKGGKALWDPIQFTNWLAENKLKNKPTEPEQKLEQKALITFVKKNVEVKHED